MNSSFDKLIQSEKPVLIDFLHSAGPCKETLVRSKRCKTKWVLSNIKLMSDKTNKSLLSIKCAVCLP
jgi:hypothetical protein